MVKLFFKLKNKQVIEVTTSSCERKKEIGEKKKKKNKRVNKWERNITK